MVGGEIGFHLPQGVGGRSDQAHSQWAISHIAQLPRVQGCKSLPYLAEDSEGHGLPEYVFSGSSKHDFELLSPLYSQSDPFYWDFG